MSKTPMTHDFEVQKFETDEKGPVTGGPEAMEPSRDEVAKHESGGKAGKERSEKEAKEKIVDEFFANLTICEFASQQKGQMEKIGNNTFNISFLGLDVDGERLEKKEKESGYNELKKDLASGKKNMENIECVFSVKSGDGDINIVQKVPASAMVKGQEAINKFIETAFSAGADKSKKEQREDLDKTKITDIVVPTKDQGKTDEREQPGAGSGARNNTEKPDAPAVEQENEGINAGRQINMVVDGALGTAVKGGNTGKTVNPEKPGANPKPLDKLEEQTRQNK